MCLFFFAVFSCVFFIWRGLACFKKRKWFVSEQHLKKKKNKKKKEEPLFFCCFACFKNSKGSFLFWTEEHLKKKKNKKKKEEPFKEKKRFQELLVSRIQRAACFKNRSKKCLFQEKNCLFQEFKEKTCFLFLFCCSEKKRKHRFFEQKNTFSS